MAGHRAFRFDVQEHRAHSANNWRDKVRALESISPDRERYPAFDNNLRLSMRRETDLFFAEWRR